MRVNECIHIVVWLACSLSRRSVADKRALLIIDVQNCFLNGGRMSLEVTEGIRITDKINQIRQRHGRSFEVVVFIVDQHCQNSIVFASQHPRKKEFDVIDLRYNDRGIFII